MSTTINPDIYPFRESERIITTSELLDTAQLLSDEHKFDDKFLDGVIALAARLALPETPPRHWPTSEYIIRLAIGGPV